MHLLRIDTISYVLFRSVAVFVGVQLYDENFRNYCKPLTHLIARVSNAHKYARAFNAFLSRVLKVSPEEGDFALLLPAEEAVIPKNRRINKHTNKHMNATNIIVL